MTGEQYRRYPESLTMRQVSVDARGKDNRAEQFKVVTTILDTSIYGGQIVRKAKSPRTTGPRISRAAASFIGDKPVRGRPSPGVLK